MLRVAANGGKTAVFNLEDQAAGVGAVLGADGTFAVAAHGNLLISFTAENRSSQPFLSHCRCDIVMPTLISRHSRAVAEATSSAP